jgi:hypothetical protein
MVYVLGVENVAQKEGNMHTCNELLVALIRARLKLWDLMSIGFM